ncbi:MAG: IS66 family insertion sequence element accessory protein TnpB [Bdellovibrionales bacterium]|nr:IS66 family insertion sequence element accessory protein TnpB [Bdellovibrionales bacterium]
MRSLKDFDNIYLYRPFADFRKGIYGLAGIVQDQMMLAPIENHLFIFCNRARNRVKLLYWDQSGFALWYKILEKEKFLWPDHFDTDAISVTSKEIDRFLKGFNPWQVPHQKLNYKIA